MVLFEGVAIEIIVSLDFAVAVGYDQHFNYKSIIEFIPWISGWCIWDDFSPIWHRIKLFTTIHHLCDTLHSWKTILQWPRDRKDVSIKGSTDVAVHLLLLLGAAMTMWLSFWLAEQEVQGSIPGLANWIPEIGHLLFQSRDMAVRLLKRRKLLLLNRDNDILRRLRFDIQKIALTVRRYLVWCLFVRLSIWY